MLTQVVADRALERLDQAVDMTRLRLRAEYLGLTTNRSARDAEKQLTVDWIRAGPPIGDVDAFLEWLDMGVKSHEPPALATRGARLVATRHDLTPEWQGRSGGGT